MPDNAGKTAPYPPQTGSQLRMDLQRDGMHDSFMTTTNPLQPAAQAIERPGMVVHLRRPAISAKVIKELLRLGYLQPAKRFKPQVVERAVMRLRADLVRDGVVKGGNSLGDPIAPDADDNRLSTRPSASVPEAST
jgi:hypothetical protein